MLAPTRSLADVLRCKIEGYNEDIFITTSPLIKTTVSTPGSASRPASAIEPLLSLTAWGLSHSLN
jgi:hypothetical protein